ncbi:MAG: capsular biosynthesis protein [Bacteroidota bacterium]|nr:capsular biosynthesis protein [Bacteroidota bacterium]
MQLVNIVKGLLLKNKYVKKFSNNLKVKKFYSNGLKSESEPETILFWTTGGLLVQTNLESVIAASLKLRGHNVRMILCDAVYKGCAKRIYMPEVPIEEWGKFCGGCIKINSQLLDKLGVRYTYISELVTEAKALELRSTAEKVTLQNYKTISLDGIQLGSHLESAMMRHTRGGSYIGCDNILIEYAYTVLVNAEASKNAMREFGPTRVYMSHGIYADWGPALSVFLKNNIPITSYISCYLTAHFFFGTVKNFNETFLTIKNNAWDELKLIELNDTQKSRLKSFLEKRYQSNGASDLKGILKEFKGESKHYYDKYDIDPEKPAWGIMTHINWDAMSDYFPMVHSNFDEWLYETVKEIYHITDVQWLIKIHPSEFNDNPDTGCQKFIENNFPDLPPHIKVLKMDDDISPLDFYHMLDGAVTVMGTGGLELSLKGKPVILAGEAHYGKKGFTYDAKNNEHYKQLLREAVNTGGLDDEKISLAWKYAYIYFIQKQIPLTPTISEDLYVIFDLLELLIPGKNKHMDFLCDRIIDGKDFIMPVNLVQMAYLTDKEQIRKFA